MYLPHAFREDDPAELLAFMRANSFATLVSTVDGVPVASHVPLVISAQDDEIVLTGHLAKQNPQWQAFGVGDALAVFSGPHAYISPAHYEKRESVPTWNYMAVHAYGVPEAISPTEDPAELHAMVAELIGAFDDRYLGQWDSLPAKYRDGMLQGIVGFRMRVTRLEGKYKLSQNRSLRDQHTVAAALSASRDQAASAVGRVMTERLAGPEAAER